MSEFKLPGVKYVSQWNGNSLNSGDPTTPYAHPADSASSTQLVIVGPGVYNGIWSGVRRLQGDGKVILDLNGIAGASLFANAVTENIHFKNGSWTGQEPAFQNCIFENISAFRYNINVAAFVKNIILESALGSVFFNNAGTSFDCANNLILENATGVNKLALSYLPIGKTLTYTGTSANFINNCINGKIKISGVDYELKKLFDGSARPDANPGIPDLATATGFSDTYTTRGNFAGDPKFIDVTNRMVEADSDLLKKSGTFGFIGAVTPGKKIPVNASDPNISITTTDIDTTTDPANWIIQSPATEGFINIIWKVSDNISEIQRIFLDALLTFNGAASGGSVGNNNVPDNFPASYSPLSQAGLKPNRLVYELRTSQSIAMPTSDAQWDNDSSTLGTSPGAYYLQEWNTKPTIIDVAGVKYGNGNPQAVGGAANGINARWAQAKIRLTNNRAF